MNANENRGWTRINTNQDEENNPTADERRFRGYRKHRLAYLAWLITFNALKVADSLANYLRTLAFICG